MSIFHQLTEQEYLHFEAARQGVCLQCDAWKAGIDPGAAGIKCDSCGDEGVHGVEQALLLGAIQIRF